MAVATKEKVNGFDAAALKEIIGAISEDSAKGKVRFQVTSTWKGNCRSDCHVESYTLAGERIARDFTIPADEPTELLGDNKAPNPQEILMAGLNACMLVGYVCGCSLNGIQLEKLEIETGGELDMRGFLGIDESVKPGYEEIHYTVRIKGNGTEEQFREIHETVMATSPNFFNISRPIRLVPHLVVE